jgi:LSD1 subclass zinc finger protein
MMVRCGACRNQFDVPGAGRFACPVCGSVNVVREAAGGAPSNMGGYPAAPGVAGSAPPPPPPPPPASDTPSPRLECPNCSFTFIVGDIEVATCPNCGVQVNTGTGTLVETGSSEEE